MRSHYPHLPNPVMFSAKRHKRPSMWQKALRNPDVPALLFVGAIVLFGMTVSSILEFGFKSILFSS